MSQASILSIGGNDPSGGAGLTMDARVGQCYEVTNLPILSCISAQNGDTVSRVDWLSKEQLQAQLKAVFHPNSPQVIKIGLFANRELIDCFVDYYQEHIISQVGGNKPIIIYDPIFANGQGSSFLSKGESLAQLITCIKERLLPICAMITPNYHELCALSEQKIELNSAQHHNAVIQLLHQLEQQSRVLPTLLLSGGHGDNRADLMNEYFVLNNGEIEYENIQQRRFAGNYRGTGCALSSAIACLIAKFLSTQKAIKPFTLKQQSQIIQDGFDFVHRAVEYTCEKNSFNPQLEKHKQILYLP